MSGALQVTLILTPISLKWLHVVLFYLGFASEETVTQRCKSFVQDYMLVTGRVRIRNQVGLTTRSGPFSHCSPCHVNLKPSGRALKDRITEEVEFYFESILILDTCVLWNSFQTSLFGLASMLIGR
jgi:hypothetical protein